MAKCIFDSELRFARGPKNSFVARRQEIEFAPILDYFVM